jgi:peptide/nickel transport system substrate-binding protein
MRQTLLATGVTSDMPDQAGGRSGLRLSGLLAATAIATLMATTAAAQEVLRVAITDEPPHLDTQMTTATLTTIINLNMMETLYAFNADGEAVPLLVASETMSDDGLTAVLTLRDDVTFHNGDSLMAEDVVASLQRWGEHGGRGKLFFDKVASVEATGEREVTITFTDVFGPWKNLLAFVNGGPAIYPSETMAAAGGEPLAPEAIIGTGPFRFSEWRPNRYIELVKFEDYAPHPDPASGYAGGHEALVDAVQFIAVPDVGTRVSGVQAGDYDYAERITGDLYGDLQADPSVETIRHGSPTMPLLFFNSAGGLFQDNYALRRAILASLTPADAMAIAGGPEELWDAQGSFYPEGHLWYSEGGLGAFPAQGDAEAAKRLAEEAGYAGEPIRFMLTTSYPEMYDTGSVAVQQMEAAGFNVDLQIYDWPTVVNRRGDPELWDIFVTTHGAVPDPSLFTFLNDNYPGWWTSPEKKALEAQFVGTTDFDERKQLWDQIQALAYEQIPVIKPGDIYLYDIHSPDLQGLPEQLLIWPAFYGVGKG